MNIFLKKKHELEPCIPVSHSEAATAWQCGVGIGDLGDRAATNSGTPTSLGTAGGLPSKSSRCGWQSTNCDLGEHPTVGR